MRGDGGGEGAEGVLSKKKNESQLVAFAMKCLKNRLKTPGME